MSGSEPDATEVQFLADVKAAAGTSDIARRNFRHLLRDNLMHHAPDLLADGIALPEKGELLAACEVVVADAMKAWGVMQ